MIEQLPWDKIGDLDGIAAKVAGCVGGALSIVESQKVEFDKAMDTAKQCYEMADEINKSWAKRAAKAAPAAPVLRSRLSVVAHEGEFVGVSIRRALPTAARILFR